MQGLLGDDKTVTSKVLEVWEVTSQKKKIDNDCLYDYFAMKLVNVSKGDISLTIELLKILQIHVLYCLKVVSLEHKRFIPFFLLRIMFQVTSKVCPSSIH